MLESLLTITLGVTLTLGLAVAGVNKVAAVLLSTSALVAISRIVYAIINKR